MAKDNVADQEQTTAATLQLVLVNSKLTLLAFCLMKVEVRFKFECLAADVEHKGLECLCNNGARSHHLAEVVVSDTVELVNGLEPLLLQKRVDGTWHPNV